jgi:predicted RND superfamily exporter protein
VRYRLPFLFLFATLLGIAVVGLTRLRFETNVLEVLPSELPSVAALKVSQKYFDNDQQLVLVLQSEEEEIFEEDVADLATLLREKLAPAKVLYKSELEENPEAAARALSELWRDAPADDLKKLADRLLDPAALTAHLTEVKSNISGSFDQQNATMAAYDPLGFLQHPAVQELLDSEFSFQSEDGKFQIILISNPHPGNGYKEQAAWIEEIRQVVNSWPGLKENGLTFGFTGGPAFNAEIGAGMEEDMSGTIMITSLMIGALFFFVQRHMGQLALTLGMMGLIFVITLGLGGWIYGTLNLVSVGFAAILLGLAIDYPVVIARQSIGEAFTAQSLRKIITPNIFWAAVTTVIVFGGLILSSFNGVRQLGVLISIGLATAALVTLTFTPMFLARFPCKPPRAWFKTPFVTLRTSLVIVAASLIASATCFVVRGGPKVDFDFAMVQPDSSEAAATFEKIKTKFAAWSENNLQVLASARSWDELREVAAEGGKKLEEAKSAGVLEHYQWPQAFIPDVRARDANRDQLEKIAANKEQILQTLKSSGFTESGVALDSMILTALSGESNPADLDGLASHFLRHSVDGNYYLSGLIKTRDVVTDDNLAALGSYFNPQFTATGWSILKADLLPLVKRDFYWLILPTAGLLFVSLIAVFRSLRDAATATVVLVTVLVMLNAFLVATGQRWNFLSGVAIPLICGSGVDYCIHLMYSLRRVDGDLSKVWNNAGKAVLFCGCSTVIGFGSLMFASNAMLKSMGIMCSMAVVLTATMSLVVVPPLWKWGRK